MKNNKVSFYNSIYKANLMNIKFNIAVTPYTVSNIIQDYSEFDLNPPYQREECWNPERKVALIKSIMNNIPIGILHLVQKPSKIGYFVLDGKQRLLTAEQFYRNEFKIPVYYDENSARVDVLEYPGVKYKKMSYMKMLNHSNKYVKNLARSFTNFNFGVVYWPSMDILIQRALFIQINYSQQLGVNERIYCPNFMVKKLFSFVLNETKLNNITNLMRKQARENSKCICIRLIHDICILCFGQQLNSIYKPVELTAKRAKNSANYLQELFMEQEISETETFSIDTLKKINFDIIYGKLFYAFEVLDYALSLEPYREKRASSEIDLLYIKNVTSFLLKLDQEGKINLTNLSTTDKENITLFSKNYITKRDDVKLDSMKKNSEKGIKAHFDMMNEVWEEICSQVTRI